MTRQDVPKLTGTPRRPRRAEPPAPTASRFPSRSLFRPREPCAQPRVCQPRFSSRECPTRALVTEAIGAFSFAFACGVFFLVKPHLGIFLRATRCGGETAVKRR